MGHAMCHLSCALDRHIRLHAAGRVSFHGFALLAAFAVVSFARTTPHPTKATSITSCPVNFDPLAQQREFDDPSNDCCFQAASRESYRVCGDIEFCFGVMISHPDAVHSNCCDNFPSCKSFKELENTLDTLLILSYFDIALSVVILALVAFHFILLKRDKPLLLKKITLGLLCFEFLDMCLCSVIIGIVKSSGTLETAENLREASCFKQTGDESSISDVIGELEKYKAIAIVELAIDIGVFLLHVVEACHQNSVDETNVVLVASAYIGDVAEFLLAVVSVVVYLKPTINAFDELHVTLSDPSSLSPCVRTCCVLGALLPKSTTSSSTRPSPASAYPTPLTASPSHMPMETPPTPATVAPFQTDSPSFPRPSPTFVTSAPTPPPSPFPSTSTDDSLEFVQTEVDYSIRIGAVFCTNGNCETQESATVGTGALTLTDDEIETFSIITSILGNDSAKIEEPAQVQRIGENVCLTYNLLTIVYHNDVLQREQTGSKAEKECFPLGTTQSYTVQRQEDTAFSGGTAFSDVYTHTLIIEATN